MQPADHTGVCFSAARGFASRGQAQYLPKAQIAEMAIEALANDPERCICPKRSKRNTAPRRHK
jgi:hypothetical protein